MRSGPKKLVLQNGDTFKLDRTDVIVDGVMYAVDPRKVSELRRRSVKIKPSKAFQSKDEFLDLNAIDIAEKLVRSFRSRAYVKDHRLKPYAVLGNAAIWFPYRLDNIEIRLVVAFSLNSVRLSAYYPPTASLQNFAEWEVLKVDFKKFLKWLSATYGLTMGRRKTTNSIVGGIRFIDGSIYSGKIKSYITGWTL